MRFGFPGPRPPSRPGDENGQVGLAVLPGDHLSASGIVFPGSGIAAGREHQAPGQQGRRRARRRRRRLGRARRWREKSAPPPPRRRRRSRRPGPRARRGGAGPHRAGGQKDHPGLDRAFRRSRPVRGRQGGDGAHPQRRSGGRLPGRSPGGQGGQCPLVRRHRPGQDRPRRRAGDPAVDLGAE